MQTRGSGTDTNYDLEPRPQGSSCCRVYDVQHRHKTSPNLPQDFPRLPMNQSWHQDFPRLPQHFLWTRAGPRISQDFPKTSPRLPMDQSWPQDFPKTCTKTSQDFPWTRAGPRIPQALPKTSPKLVDVQTASATLTKKRAACQQIFHRPNPTSPNPVAAWFLAQPCPCKNEVSTPPPYPPPAQIDIIVLITSCCPPRGSTSCCQIVL